MAVFAVASDQGVEEIGHGCLDRANLAYGRGRFDGEPDREQNDQDNGEQDKDSHHPYPGHASLPLPFSLLDLTAMLKLAQQLLWIFMRQAQLMLRRLLMEIWRIGAPECRFCTFLSIWTREVPNDDAWRVNVAAPPDADNRPAKRLAAPESAAAPAFSLLPACESDGIPGRGAAWSNDSRRSIER